MSEFKNSSEVSELAHAQSTFANIADLSVSSLDYVEFYRNCLKNLLVLPRCDIRRVTHYSIHVIIQHMQRPAL